MWIIEGKTSYDISGTNIHTNKDGVHEVWATKVDGTNRLIKRSTDIEEVKIIKEAIDYACKNGEKTVELS